jgi:integrase
MEFVQPIRDRKKVESMRRYLAGNKRDALLFTLGINSGLRISDILRIEVHDVIDERGRIREHYELREKKTRKAKRFPFAKNTQKAIAEYLDGYDGDRSRPLFVSRKSNDDGDPRPISRQQAYDILNDAAQAVGITESIGTHSLRKTFGYHAYKAGTDITLLQHILNHSAPSVTLRYIGITQDDIDDVVINLNL